MHPRIIRHHASASLQPHLLISHGSLPFSSRRLYILAGVVLGDPRAVEPSLTAVVEVEAHRYERRGGGFGCVRLLSSFPFVARPNSMSTIWPHLSLFLASSLFVRSETVEQRLRGFVTEASESNTSSKQASVALCSTGQPGCLYDPHARESHAISVTQMSSTSGPLVRSWNRLISDVQIALRRREP
jgi:hypothetical protein